MKPAAYPVPTATVELIQTHVSWIFLTDTHAFKLKKPVNFGFLDFSTIDRRRFYCNEELRLNRRLCPDIYEAVADLRETNTGAAFHGNGQVIDYAVMMKRLPADRMLDRLVECGEVTAADMKNVASVVSRFHAEAQRSAYISDYGSLDKIQYNWRENFEQLVSFEATTLPAVDREVIRSWIATFTETNQELFNHRVEQGFIRECDGDLHLENICLFNDRVCIFDCIEFNERFRFCDTAADIAFLLMDLDFHGRSDLSDAVVTSYCSLSGDKELLELVDFYKVYRAVVRGKVESFHLNDEGISLEARESARRRAIRYFRLARGYIERLRLPPTLFITCGTMGCGKSTLAEQLAFELGITSYNSDVVRKQIAGLTPVTTVHESYGHGLYSESVTVSTYRELKRAAEQELVAGRSTIIDASFGDARKRAEFAGLAKKYNARFFILLVTCTEDEQKKRLDSRHLAGNSISDGRAELLEQQKNFFEAPAGTEGRIIQLNSIATPEQLANGVYEELD